MSDPPRNTVTFHCRRTRGGCGRQWEAPPQRVEDAPEQQWHPWRYWATCPDCGAQAEQAHWEANLLKAWRATERDTHLTRLNAMRHGLRAEVANYFPARPGKYPACEGCDLREDVCPQERACLRQMAPLARHLEAADRGDPSILSETHAGNQARIQWVIDQIFHVLAADGVRIKEPQWYVDKEGTSKLAGWTDAKGNFHPLVELKAHPLLRHLIDYIQKNAMTLADQQLTPKTQEETSAMRGHLEDQAAGRQSVLEYQQRQAQALEDLRGMVERSREHLRNDPILIEHGEQDGG